MSLIKFAALAMVLLAMVFSPAEAAVCIGKGSTKEKVGECKVKFTVHKCLKSPFKSKYKAQAKEMESGKSAKYKWKKSKKKAAKAAAEKLFKNHPELTAKCYPNGPEDIHFSFDDYEELPMDDEFTVTSDSEDFCDEGCNEVETEVITMEPKVFW